MMINLGVVRVLALRAGQIIQLLMIVLLYFNIGVSWFVIAGIGITWLVADYWKIYGQEQDYALQNNKALLDRLDRIEGLLECREGVDGE